MGLGKRICDSHTNNNHNVYDHFDYVVATNKYNGCPNNNHRGVLYIYNFYYDNHNGCFHYHHHGFNNYNNYSAPWLIEYSSCSHSNFGELVFRHESHRNC